MSRRPSKTSDDPFDGLCLPISAWKALESAQVASLDQLRAMAPRIEQVPGIGPDIACVIRDRLERFGRMRTLRVRLIFPKRCRGKGGSQ
jgi:hypothetical protein